MEPDILKLQRPERLFKIRAIVNFRHARLLPHFAHAINPRQGRLQGIVAFCHTANRSKKLLNILNKNKHECRIRNIDG